MTRDSFIFNRSFYEAVRHLPPDTQAEILRAVCEYVFNNVQPANMSDATQGIFVLMCAAIERSNKPGDSGSCCGCRKQDSAQHKCKEPQPTPTTATPLAPSVSIGQEIELMNTDTEFCAEVIDEFNLGDTLPVKLKAFARSCRARRPNRPHNNIDDAKEHFRAWLSMTLKSNKTQQPTPPDETTTPPPDYSFNGGFGGVDT